MKINRISIVFVLLSTFSFCATAEYKTKSVFSNDYKCVSEETGGFNHSKSGHKLTLLKNTEEFFITHISNIPNNAMLKLSEALNLEYDVDHVREAFEKRIMKKKFPFGSSSHDYVIEDSSYFIREPEMNPNEALTYLSKGCTSVITPTSGGEIYCYKTDSSKSFILNIDTMRFSYSYTGSWHNKRKNGYYGDSSVFAFGSCKKYYR